jgi:hypothetical protein
MEGRPIRGALCHSGLEYDGPARPLQALVQ